MTIASSTSTQKKGEKLAQRLSYILAQLHQGKQIDKHALAEQFGVDIRTIDRDLSERLTTIAERNKNGLWQLTNQARGTIPATHLHRYARMVGTEKLLPNTKLDYLVNQINTPEADRSIYVQPLSQENLTSQKPLFLLLQNAIEQKLECHFHYKNKDRIVHPYRLIHRAGIWYLAATEKNILKNFSVALIEKPSINTDVFFTPKPELYEYINNKDGIWFTEQATEVILRVAPNIAHYFTRRDLLPKQQNRLDRDGSLQVTTSINHINQLLPIVRYWLPDVRILQPASWHQELLNSLHHALEKWED